MELLGQMSYESSEDKWRELLEQSKNHPDSAFYLSVLARDEVGDADVRMLFNQPDVRDDPKAQYLRGVYEGDDVEELFKAAKQGHAYGCRDLGYLVHNGVPLHNEKIDKDAMMWFQKAAKAGCPSAWYWISEVTRKKDNTADETLLLEYFCRGAAMGSGSCKREAFRLLLGQEKLKEALEFAQSADRSHLAEQALEKMTLLTPPQKRDLYLIGRTLFSLKTKWRNGWDSDDENPTNVFTEKVIAFLQSLACEIEIRLGDVCIYWIWIGRKELNLGKDVATMIAKMVFDSRFDHAWQLISHATWEEGSRLRKEKELQ
jgi:hypothetical protein